MAQKSWKDKFYKKSQVEVKTIDKSFWGFDEGSKMLIPTPQIIQDYISQSEKGTPLDLQKMRQDLALENKADFTCPMTTGIFLRIVAEYNYEKWSQKEGKICPFWRIIDPKSKLLDKLSFDKTFVLQNRKDEDID